ncbi:BnaC08g44530D [Brassica napus]|uniref:BnaC08g44530D protein n=1 Tax=Brassica napus TaxID=3708 RepID=A0A078FD72_BRANA|nr:BnaC08g44530D [Brassica napus]
MDPTELKRVFQMFDKNGDEDRRER